MNSQTETQNKAQDIIIILDESGSMSKLDQEPVQAVNSFIEDQKNTVTSDESTCTLWKFNRKVTKCFDDVPLKDTENFSDYTPNNMTALYDALGHAINTKLAKNNPNDVVCVIITDGRENASVDFTSEKVKELISLAEKQHNWNFVYLGANQDVFIEGSTIGISSNLCAEFECLPGELIALTRGTSEAVADFRQSSSQGEEVYLELPGSDPGVMADDDVSDLNVPELQRSLGVCDDFHNYNSITDAQPY